ncbi:hypothetical protein BS47DRAFT_1358695 [Hydnum rufescens UP504]|uniref:Uncharacterized protein n=1 Tax=Hydnum rufescens UP504 TaxID=1448309 RepID=A0A9P6E1J1_9AGAM|nr:hypothetical protein BS47DRAFT_1358695 [Hydnum rufescens UP504]
MHWVIEQGHPKQAKSPGPFHWMHLAHLKQIKKFLNESYYEAILKWLQLSPNIALHTAFHKLWEAMGKATIPNANLPASRQFPFIPSILHGNFSVLEILSTEIWPPLDSLVQRISKPTTCIFEDPDELTEFDQPSSSTHPQSASPEERQSDQKLQLPLQALLWTPSPPLSMPAQGEASPTDSLSITWGVSSHQLLHYYPVPLAPFVFFNSLKDLEQELYVHYQGVIRSWYLNNKKLILLFNDKAQACQVTINQIQAAKDYPTEPLTKAIPFVDDECYHSWSPNAVYAAKLAVTSH